MPEVPDRSELERLGLLSPDAPNAGDRLRLLERVFELGATMEEVVEAASTANLGDLALDLAIRPPGKTYTIDEFAEIADADADLVRSMWRALGLPASGPVRVTPDLADALTLLAAASAWFTPETTLALARVVGSSSARMAEALISAFRVDVEAPGHAADRAYSDMVMEYTTAASELLPLFLDGVNAAFRRHMVLVSYSLWSTDEERSAVIHERTVGFADLVGSTEAVRTGSVRALADMVRHFEELVWDLVARADGRVVKLIGDEAMFVLDDPARACGVALDLIDASPQPIRVGLAHGTVAALYGDYYGETVNLAARLVAIADPGTVAVSDAVHRLVSGETAFAFEDLGQREVKGFDAPVPVQRVARAQ